MVASPRCDFRGNYARSRRNDVLPRAGCRKPRAAHEYFLGPAQDFAGGARRFEGLARRPTIHRDRRIGKWAGYEFFHAQGGGKKNNRRATGRNVQVAPGLRPAPAGHFSDVWKRSSLSWTAQNPVPTRTSSVRWGLIFWLFVLSAVAYLDRVNLSIAGAKLTEEFNISNIELGLVFSAFLLGYALFQTPAGWLADRFGPRRVLTGGVIWWGIFSALTAAISHNISNAVMVLIGIRFLLGAGEAIMYPASNQFVARWIPTEERGIANGVIFAGVGIGAGITPPLISAIMLQYGWRSSFLLSALIGL